MKITLETVRQVLREALGFHSYVATFITEVREDESIPTAAITKDGRLRYNSAFAERHVRCKEDLFSLIFHELLHPMFCHFIYRSGKVENIAADAVINAVISRIYYDQSQGGALFCAINEPRGLGGLLRPASRMGASRYEKLYDQLYPQWNVGGIGKEATTGELIQTLKVLMDHESAEGVTLIGSHDGQDGQQGTDGPIGAGEMDPETLAKIAEEVKRSIGEKGIKDAGHNQTLVALMMEALRSHLSIRKAILRRFATKRKIDRFKSHLRRRRVTVSPIPIRPSKRELVILANDGWPFHFHNRNSHLESQNQGLAIYLDVSGSVNEHLPKIIGVLRDLRREITSVFQFSNDVVETSFETLLKGEVSTTYGTDFDCVAESIMERGFDKAIILTDGWASMNDENKEGLKRTRLDALTILFGGKCECADLAKFGDVVELEDVC